MSNGRPTPRGRRRARPVMRRPAATMAIGALKSTSKHSELRPGLTEAKMAPRAARADGRRLGHRRAGRAASAGLFLMPEEGDMEIRVAAVAGLSGQGTDGTLMQPLRKVALFRRPDGSPFSLWQDQAAVELRYHPPGTARPADRLRRPAVRRGGEGSTRCGCHASSAHTSRPPRPLHRGRTRGTRLRLNWQATRAPRPDPVRDLLEFVAETCRRFCATRRRADGTVETPSATAAAMAPLSWRRPAASLGAEQALRQVTEIAAWFRRNEPSSPIGFTLDEAAPTGAAGAA